MFDLISHSAVSLYCFAKLSTDLFDLCLKKMKSFDCNFSSSLYCFVVVLVFLPLSSVSHKIFNKPKEQEGMQRIEDERQREERRESRQNQRRPRRSMSGPSVNRSMNGSFRVGDKVCHCCRCLF